MKTADVAVITEPTIEPVSLAEVKLHLRVDADADDVYLAGLMRLARVAAEERTRRALITQTLEAYYPCFPACDFLELPRPPLQSVTSVKYYDADGTETTFSSTRYSAVTTGLYGRVVLDYGDVWPVLVLRPFNGVVVRYVAGYGDGPGNVPEAIRHWMLMYVAELYERREAVSLGAPIMPNPYFNGLLDTYVIPRV